ncbi:MAG: DUF4271 domain-containing protein [Bacteroides sp.]|nr:DUF4271 domain-containing protein [Bacteroides sp.]
MNPSLQTDTVLNPFAPAVCREYEAPASAVEKLTMTVGRVPYTVGMPPAERKQLPGYDSGVLCLIIGVFLLLAYNFLHYSTFLKNFTYDLWAIRRTDDASAVRTFSETGIQMSIVMLACLSEGIIVNAAMSAGSVVSSLSTFIVIAALSIIAVVYYLWQLLVYRLVGYVFTDRLSAMQWLKGFNASQALLGMTLTIPALVVLFNPERASVVVTVGAVCYVLARLIFIFKGFRLFYDNFGSLLYFILYLCTLEIVPPVILYRCVAYFSQSQP